MHWTDGLAKGRPPEPATTAREAVAIKKAIRDSQVFEFLELYGDPENPDEAKIKKYWLPQSEALADVRMCLAHLNEQRWHYGPRSKLLLFEFRYVRRFGDRAEVGTREQWYLPLYRFDGRLVTEENPDFGPYDIEYTLKKVAAAWLVETTTTPYAHKQLASDPQHNGIYTKVDLLKIR